MNPSRQYVELSLTCEGESEANKIARQLLKEHLIVCAKQVPVVSQYWWKGQIEKADEVLLVMDSAEDLFEEVEAQVKKIHSYETFNLQAKISVKQSAGVVE